MSAETQRAAPPRLRDEPSALGKALAVAARRTAAGRAGARERVWRGLAEPERDGWHRNLRWLASGAVAAAALAVAIWSARPAVSSARPIVAGAEPVVASAQPIPSSAQPRDVSWRLLASFGSVEVERASGWQAVQPGDSLSSHAKLRTGPGGAAVLALGPAQLALSSGAQLSLEEPPVLERGSCAVSITDAHRFRLAAGAYQIDSSSGVFIADTTATRVRIRSESASLELGGGARPETVAAGASWSSANPPGARAAVSQDALELSALRPLAALAGSAQPSEALLRAVALVRPEPVAAPAPSTDASDEGAQLLAQAHAAEAAHQYSAAAALYAQLANLAGPRAPAALYELARVRLRFLKQPAAALEALDEERARYPGGALQQEVALSAIEARLALQQDDATLREMNGFLEHFAQSERATEVRWLRASLQLRRSACGAAQGDLAALASDSIYGGEALFAQADCARRAGDESSARAQLHDYLKRFPRGPHARAAESLLSGEQLRAP